MFRKEQNYRYEFAGVHGDYHPRGKGSRSGHLSGNYYEGKIKNAIIHNTDSYDGVGERMLNVIKEIVGILTGCRKDEVDHICNKIEELMIEFVSSSPYGTGMFAGITALMATSLMNECPLSIGSNLTVRIIDGSIERFLLEMSRSNYYSSQLLLNFLTELTNFYVISLNQLISLYRSLLNTCLTLKSSKDINSKLKYDVFDHNSMILFSMLAYSIPYLREEHRRIGGDGENNLYGEFINDMITFYDMHMSEYCGNIYAILKGMLKTKFTNMDISVNSFDNYWRKLLEWRDQDYPRISTLIRFYRSSTISDYLSEILSTSEIKFENRLDSLVFGGVNEYLPKVLIRVPYTETMEIGDFLLLHTMDGIVEIFMQHPFEAARQLLKIPVVSSSYDLCLSITIWNSLLNPFYSYNMSYINSLVTNLIKLQFSILNDIWSPIFIGQLVNCRDKDCDITLKQFSIEKSDLTDSKEASDDSGNQMNEKSLADTEHSVEFPQNEATGNIELKDDRETTIKKEDKGTNKVINYRIFPRIENYSSLMIVKLRNHFSTVFSSQELFQNPSQKSNFWKNQNNSLFQKTQEQSSFAVGFLDSVLSGMSRIMLPQTLSSIPNENLYERINKFPSANKSIKPFPNSITTLQELGKLGEVLVFKFTNKMEINEKNAFIIEYLISVLNKQNGAFNDSNQDNDDIEMSKRFVERDRNDNERKHKHNPELVSAEIQDQNNDDCALLNNNEVSMNEQNSDQVQTENYKVLKRRRLNPSISAAPSDLTWTRDALMDLLLISIIKFGSKSLTHTRRSFGNYALSLKNWYNSTLNNQTLQGTAISDKYLDTTQHPLFDAVSKVVLMFSQDRLFVSAINYVFLDLTTGNGSEENEQVVDINDITFSLARYSEIRQLSCVFTLWGGFGMENNTVSTGYNIQKIRVILMSMVEESVVSPHTAVLYLGCVLSSLRRFINIEIPLQDKYIYQIFMDFFEIVLDILTNVSIKIAIFEEEREKDGKGDSDRSKNTCNSYKMSDENNKKSLQDPFKNKLAFSRAVVMLLVIFTSEKKVLNGVDDTGNEIDDGVYAKLLNSAAYDICLMYGSYIRDFVNSGIVFDNESFLESEPLISSILENLKNIYDLSLESLLNASDTNKRLDNKWVPWRRNKTKNGDDKGITSGNLGQGSDLKMEVETGISPQMVDT